MRLLLISDTQTDRQNLQEQEIVLQELLRAAKKYQPDAIVHAGDVKDVQNDLISVSVIKFWIHATKTIRNHGFRFIVLRGNHDRISQSADSKDWLDILKEAGAEVVNTQPEVLRVGEDMVGFLPFTSDRRQERKWAELLAMRVQGELGRKILIFHTAVQGGKMNAAGMTGVGITPEELYAKEYDLCIGGHFHGHGCVDENVWYVGSPFTHDWNEVNEPKGIVIVDVTQKRTVVKQLLTSVPHWYDAEYLERMQKTPEPGAYIRSRVPVTSKRVTDQIRGEERRLKQLYGGGVRLFVVPQVEKPEDNVLELSGSTDKEKVEQYVAYTYPEGGRFQPKAVVGFMASCLEEAGPGLSRSQSQIRLISAEGTRVLSFPHVKVNYQKQGLVLIEGYNEQTKRSNGAGKSGFLSLLTIGFFGRTPKGQVNDEWAQESNEGTARLTLKFETHTRVVSEIERTRRPHGLWLREAGRDASRGLSGKAKNETQGDIEQKLGFDYQMFLNAVYVDDAITNGFLFGTPKTRMDLIGKLVNLERFEVALKVVSKRLDKTIAAQGDAAQRLDELQEFESSLDTQLTELKLSIQTDWQQKQTEALEEERSLVAQLDSVMAVARTYEEYQSQLDDLVADEKRFLQIYRQTDVQYQTALREFKKYRALVEQGRCPHCGQETGGVETKVTELKPQLNELIGKLDKFKTATETVKQSQLKLQKHIDSFHTKKESLEHELSTVRSVLRSIEIAAREEEERNNNIKSKHAGIQRQIKEARRHLRALRAHLKWLGVEVEMLDYVKKAFTRSGMPLLLCQQLCPVLNSAAQRYAQILFQGMQQVRFSVEDGEFAVNVINPTGSRRVEGQSVGESAMAGLITALALREAAPKTNILILDEPANGLDQIGAKMFAEGLIQIAEEFETVLVTTHNQVMSTLLEGRAKLWQVIKNNQDSVLKT